MDWSDRLFPPPVTVVTLRAYYVDCTRSWTVVASRGYEDEGGVTFDGPVHYEGLARVEAADLVEAITRSVLDPEL